MRKLASIQVVDKVAPVDNSDNLDVVSILGWDVVVQRGSVQAGSLVVYCEVDSYLPETPDFEFLRSRCYRAPIVKDEETLLRGGFRIKTVKLRGQISQGIVLPLSILPQGTSVKVGQDVTDILGIIKYDPPVPANLSGVQAGNFPDFIPKTDEIRIQSFGRLWEQVRGVPLDMTEKLDGTSLTVFALADGTRGVCSRNYQINPTEKSDNVYANQYHLSETLETLARRDGVPGYAIQAEVIGPGIQGNKYNLREVQVRVFNAMAVGPGEGPVYLSRERINELAAALGLETVPFLGTVVIEDHTTREIVDMSRGVSTLNRKVQREGIVFRSNSSGNKLGFKAINPQFLLKYDA